MLILKVGKKIFKTAPFLLPRTAAVSEGVGRASGKVFGTTSLVFAHGCVFGLKDRWPDADGLSSRSSQYAGTLWLNGLDHTRPVKL